MADVGGVGREFPLSMEKLSPILAFYVEDGLERGAARCLAVLGYGGMGHTAGIHTRSREAATKYGLEMPAALPNRRASESAIETGNCRARSVPTAAITAAAL